MHAFSSSPRKGIALQLWQEINTATIYETVSHTVKQERKLMNRKPVLKPYTDQLTVCWRAGGCDCCDSSGGFSLMVYTQETSFKPYIGLSDAFS